MENSHYLIEDCRNGMQITIPSILGQWKTLLFLSNEFFLETWSADSGKEKLLKVECIDEETAINLFIHKEGIA